MSKNDNQESKEKIRTKVVFLASFLLIIAIFILDLQIELGVANGVLYVLVIILISTISSVSSRKIISIGVVCTIMIFLGWFLSPAGGEEWKIMLNRLYALIVVYSCIFLALKKKVIEEDLDFIFEAKTTKLKMHNEILQENEMRLKLTMDASHTGMVVVDSQAKIVLVNKRAEELFGYQAEELIGSAIEVLVPQAYRPGHPNLRNDYLNKPIAKILGGGKELTALRKDGTEFYAEIGLMPIRTSEGTQVVSSILDVTEKRKAQKLLLQRNIELDQKNREMEQFVYTVSHDLKAPLVTIGGNVGFLKEDVDQKKYEDMGTSIQSIEKAIVVMQQLINDLLEISRIGRIPLSPELVNMDEFVAQIRDGFSVSLKGKNVSCHVDTGMGTLFFDAKRGRQILQNLISNAIKYGENPAGQKIWITYVDKSDYGHLCIKDNGPGISEEFHEKIFELFQRLESDQEGSGVGLGIVRKIAELHGGQAWLHSKPGQGAEFWFSLPKNEKVLQNQST